jgi:flap endonuclease-1
MGIHGLLPFLSSHNLIKKFVSWPEGSKIAIDVPIFAYKFIYTERTFDNLVAKFLLFANELKEKKCEPIFVFDGSRLDLKANERKKRSCARERTQVLKKIKTSEFLESLQDSEISIVTSFETSEGPVELDYSDIFSGIMVPTREEYQKLRSALESNSFLTRQAKFEAEALCAHLVSTQEAWASITEDTDSVAFGSPRTIFKYFSDEPMLAELDFILAGLNFSRDQFIDLCCMFGTDFCENVYKIGPKGTYTLLKKHGSWTTVFEKEFSSFTEKTKDSAIMFQEKYAKAFECFNTSCFENSDDVLINEKV